MSFQFKGNFNHNRNFIVFRYLIEDSEELPVAETKTTTSLKRKLTATADEVLPQLASSTGDENSVPGQKETPAKPKPAKIPKLSAAANKKTKAAAAKVGELLRLKSLF